MAETATMKRLWSERRQERIHEPERHRFEAIVTADLGVTEDGDQVLRIEKLVKHWPGNSDDPCDGCKLCGRPRAELILDGKGRSRQDHVRLAIRHADLLFEEVEELTNEVRLLLAPPLPEAAPTEEAPRG